MFLNKPRANNIPVIALNEDSFKSWIKKQKEHVAQTAEDAGFEGQAQKTLLVRDFDGSLEMVLAGVAQPCSIFDLAATVGAIKAQTSEKLLKTASFALEVKKADIDHACLGWALGNYAFDRYKSAKNTPCPALVWPKDVDKKRVQSLYESIAMVRDLINTPTIDMGPADLDAAAKDLADKFKAKIKVTKGKMLEKNFPLVHAVGMAAAADRQPRLIEINWGKAKDPKLSIVGKGVCFDTGGLDIKPSPHMKLMKKDMGGAAHALGLALLIMANKLPVNLQVVIPAVENAVSGESFRPGDIFTSRKGITVENTNTDAEGRLILADALTYASERKPDLIIDFATLTGSARAALGLDIPAAFCNDDKLRDRLIQITEKAEDMVWPMPLHQPYQARIKSNIAELHNSASVPGDLIYSALFLENFLKDSPRWIHLDCFAWEQFGAPGRPVGGKDTGLRGMFALLEELYA